MQTRTGQHPRLRAVGAAFSLLAAIAGCDSDPEGSGGGASMPPADMLDAGPALGDSGGAPPQGGGSAEGGSQPSVDAAAGAPRPGSVGSSEAGAGGPQSGGAFPEQDVCQAIGVRSDRVRPDMLIVLDRSSSMKSNGVNRLDPSIAGIRSIAEALDSSIAFGLMVFPGNPAPGVMRQQCVPGNLVVPVQSEAAPAIGGALAGLPVLETTPTAPTLALARMALQTRAPIAGMLGPPYVVLVTDGAPNCSNGTAGPNGGRGDVAAIEASVGEIAAMAQAGIKTYVLGYDTNADAELKSALDRMAAAGGTGDTVHRPIEDQASLIAAFMQITGTALSCDFALEEAPPDPSYVLVKVNGNQVAYDAVNGWSLSPDGKTLSLRGAACDALGGSSGELSIQIQCERVIWGI